MHQLTYTDHEKNKNNHYLTYWRIKMKKIKLSLQDIETVLKSKGIAYKIDGESFEYIKFTKNELLEMGVSEFFADRDSLQYDFYDFASLNEFQQNAAIDKEDALKRLSVYIDAAVDNAKFSIKHQYGIK